MTLMPKEANLPIVIADDDANSRRLLSRFLGLHYQVTACEDGSAALKFIQQNGPALLVLDYEMPDFNGAQVIEAIRSSSDAEVAQSPIIMLTGLSNAEHEVECLRAGADDFVTKPVNLAVLEARIDTHLRLHSLRKQTLLQNIQLEKYRALQEEDLEAARVTQQAILPARLPRVKGWGFATHFHPLIQIGGDFYDWVTAPDGSLMVWISDATGHGASAALLTTLSKLLFRHAAAESATAAQLMDHVEREFQAVFKGHSFMTAACVRLSADRGEISFCGAGQPPLLIARRDGGVESIRSSRPPIGLNKAEQSVEETRTLTPGEAILLYTDGIYEVRNSRGQRMGHDSLAQSLPLLNGSVADVWLGQIMENVTAYAESVAFPDDIAALAAVYNA